MKMVYTSPSVEIVELEAPVKTEDISGWYLELNTDWFNS